MPRKKKETLKKRKDGRFKCKYQGIQFYGSTPEEADLLSGSTSAQVCIVNTGVAITTFDEADPVNKITKVSEIVLPSFETIDQIFAATVA